MITAVLPRSRSVCGFPLWGLSLWIRSLRLPYAGACQYTTATGNISDAYRKTESRSMTPIRIRLGCFGLIGAVLLVIGTLIHTKEATVGGAIVMVAGGCVIVFDLITSVIYDILRKRKASALLKCRQQLDATSFGKTFFPESPERAALAGRVRDALSDYLKLNLDGLQPDDDLNHTLDAKTDDPSLLWHLEKAFGYGQTFHDIDGFDRICKSLHTFRDLVKFVEDRMFAK